MSRRFAVLNLPFLNVEQILLNLNPVDLIEFSLLSKKCKNIVKSLRLPFTGIELLISKYNLDVIVKTGDKEVFKWVVNSDHAKKCRVFRKINGRKMRVYKLPPCYILSKCPQPALAFSKVSKYLIELFGCPVTYVQLYPDGLQNIQLFVSGFTSCLKMELAGSEQMTNEDLAFLLKNVQVNDFTFWIQPKPDFVCPGNISFQGKSLFITNDSNWFTREHLINSNLEHLYVPYNSNIKCSDFADFIAKWMDSEDTRVRSVVFHGVLQMELQMNAFDRFNPKKWDPKERGRSWQMGPNSNTATDCSDGLDILRSDGLLATILIKQYSINNHRFEFLVWHERFPATGTHII